jgi:lipoic acid synthetase
LQQVVITSVTRDDLPDGGSWVYAETIRELRRRDAKVRIEVLVPDFNGDVTALDFVLEAEPDVLNHNLETVPRLYQTVRPQADFSRSLEILRHAAARPEPPIVKSGIMVGLGESIPEVHETMQRIVATGCRILTIGQYLRPSQQHLPVVRYYEPDEFDELATAGKQMGFAHVASGPLVRSSYHAFDQVKRIETMP